MTEAEHIARCVETRACHCGEPLDQADQHNGTAWEVMVWCPECFDGATDAGRRGRDTGRGDTRDLAVQAWAEGVDPRPELAECCICEQTVTADKATSSTHHGYGYPMCDDCVDTNGN